jgi:hypothetical protein
LFNELAPDFLFLIMVSQTNSRIVMAVAGKTASVDICPGGVDTWPPLRIARRGEISTEAVLPATAITMREPTLRSFICMMTSKHRGHEPNILEFNELAPDFLFAITMREFVWETMMRKRKSGASSLNSKILGS